MSKRSGRGISKKAYIKNGLVRYTNAEGKRMWRYKKEDFKTLRELSYKYPMG